MRAAYAAPLAALVAFGLVRCSSFEERVAPAVAAPGFCEGAQTDAGAHAFCADFDEAMLIAWRGASKEQLWNQLGDASFLELAAEGRSTPNALRCRTVEVAPALDPDAGDAALPVRPQFRGGWLEYTVPPQQGLRLAVDLRFTSIVDGTMIPIEMRLGTGHEIFVNVNERGANVGFRQGGQAADYYVFAPGFPPLLNNWRRLTIELPAGRAHLRVLVDEFVAVDTDIGVPYPMFPTTALVRTGSWFYNNGPFVVAIDNLTVDALP